MTTEPPRRDDSVSDVHGDGHRDVAALLLSEDDLSDDELEILAKHADTAWRDIRSQLRVRAAWTYGVADPADFAACVRHHMDPQQRIDMMAADAYWCPECGRHLKDRRTPVATSVMLERRRLRDLYRRVDEASDERGRTEALRRFIAALGLQPPTGAMG